MSGTKISALPSATTPLAGTELVPIVQDGETRSVAASDLGGGGGGSGKSRDRRATDDLIRRLLELKARRFEEDEPEDDTAEREAIARAEAEVRAARVAVAEARQAFRRAETAAAEREAAERQRRATVALVSAQAAVAAAEAIAAWRAEEDDEEILLLAI